MQWRWSSDSDGGAEGGPDIYGEVTLNHTQRHSYLDVHID